MKNKKEIFIENEIEELCQNKDELYEKMPKMMFSLRVFLLFYVGSMIKLGVKHAIAVIKNQESKQ